MNFSIFKIFAYYIKSDRSIATHLTENGITACDDEQMKRGNPWSGMRNKTRVQVDGFENVDVDDFVDHLRASDLKRSPSFASRYPSPKKSVFGSTMKFISSKLSLN